MRSGEQNATQTIKIKEKTLQIKYINKQVFEGDF